MIEKTVPLSDDETGSELFLNAIDTETNDSNKTLESDECELQEFQSSICIWDHYLQPFHFGLYSQLLEARVILNSNCPKYEHQTGRNSERRNIQVKKIEETVLTCQIPIRNKIRCTNCRRTTDNCVCRKSSLQTKTCSSSCKKKISTDSTLQAKQTTKYDHQKVTSLIRDINVTPTLQKISTEFTKQTGKKPGMDNSRTPVRRVCKSLQSVQSLNSSNPSKLSFSSEELQIVHGVGKLTEMLTRKRCIICDKFSGSCNCGSFKAPKENDKCKYCSKTISNCICPKWKKNGSEKNDTKSLVAITRNNLRRIREDKVYENNCNIVGIIEEIKPRAKSISTPSLTKRIPKSKNTIPKITSEKIEEEDLRRTHKAQKKENNSNKPYNKLDGNREVQLPSYVKPPFLVTMNNNTSEFKTPQTQSVKNSDGNQNHHQYGIVKMEMKKESKNKMKERLKSEIVETEKFPKLEETKMSNISDLENDTTLASTTEPKHESDRCFHPQQEITNNFKNERDERLYTFIKPSSPEQNSNKQVLENNESKIIRNVQNTVEVDQPHTSKQSFYVSPMNIENEVDSSKYGEQNAEVNERSGKLKNLHEYHNFKVSAEKKINEEELTNSRDVSSFPVDQDFDENMTLINVNKSTTREPLQVMKNNTGQTENNKVGTPDITIIIEISDEADGIKCSINKNENNEEVTSAETEKNNKYSINDFIEKKQAGEMKEDETKLDRKNEVKISEDETKSINGKNKEDFYRNMKSAVEEGKYFEGVKKYSVEERKRKHSVNDSGGFDDKINNFSKGNLVRRESIDYEGKMAKFPETVSSEKNRDVLIDSENIEYSEQKDEKSKICNCYIEEIPVVISQKCKSLDKYKKCSKIPRLTSNIMSRKVPKQQFHNCSDISTNTERLKLTEEAEQCLLRAYNKYEQPNEKTTDINKMINVKPYVVTNQRSRAIKPPTCKTLGSIKRSSSFVCSTKNHNKFENADNKANDCSKYLQRPSTASEIYDRQKRCNLKNKIRDESADIEVEKSSEEFVVGICQPCSELLPLNSGKICSREMASRKDEIIKGKIDNCYAKDKRGEKSKGENTRIKTVCKQCSQTGGTLEQDIIASYVASCCLNTEKPQTEQIMIQTLLYQFAGDELNKDQSPPRRRDSSDRSRSLELRETSEHAMRSIQVQVGPSSPSKCGAAQTVTTFILTDPCTILQSDKMPKVEGKINYICGPDIPGIRTKLAMNLNDIPSVGEDKNSISKPECSNEQVESCDQYNSPICSNEKNVDSEAPEKQKTNYKVVKNDKFVFITVTPVQTDPYEPNYFIILTSPDDEAKTKKEIKNKKNSKSNTKVKSDKIPLISSTNNNPLDRFKNRMFSLDTLKSSDFLDYFQKKPVLQCGKIIESFNNPDNPTADSQKKKKQEDESAMLTEAEDRKFEDRECGPNTCDNLADDENQQKFENRGCGSDTCLHVENILKNDISPKHSDNETEDKNYELDTSKNLEESQIEETSIQNGSYNGDRTKTVSCGPENCLQDQINEVEPIKVDVYTSPDKPREMKTKEIQCEIDTCGFKKHKNACNNEICMSMQTEEMTPEEKMMNESTRAMDETEGCDVGTITDEPEKESTHNSIKYCDMQVCTNDCEKCEAASQVCMESSSCASDDCDNICENIELQEKKNNSTEDIPQFREPSGIPSEIDETQNKDEVSCASSCDPNDCEYVKAPEEQNTIQQDYVDPKRCHDNICPEKRTPSVRKPLEETFLGEPKEPGRSSEFGSFRASKRIVNTKLDDQDVSALRRAIDRFAKTKPNLMDE